MPVTRIFTADADDHQAFDSTDPERAEAYMTAAYRTTIKLSDRCDPYRFRHARLGPGPFRIDQLDHTATSQYRVEPMRELSVVRMHRGVRTDVDLGHRYGTGDVGISYQPGDPVHVRHVCARYTAVLVPLQALGDVARNRPDDDLGRLRFLSMRPTGPTATRGWVRTVGYVTDCLRADPDAMGQPILNGITTRLLAATLLAAFPNTWIAEPQTVDRTDATPTTLSRAIAFIDVNADLDISTVDVARDAGVTVRAVQNAFRRHRDTTPTAYLRRVRLDRAHRQLQAATPGDGSTVTAVAARWGFADPGRFATRYRQAFGRPPGHTLRN